MVAKGVSTTWATWPDTVQGQQPKKQRRSALADSGRHIVSTISIDILNEFRPWTGAIRSVLELYFQPYKVHPNPSPYPTVAPILVQTAPGHRNGLEVDLVWASNLTWAALHVSYGGGHGGGRSWASSNSSPHIWGILQLGPGSQV